MTGIAADDATRALHRRARWRSIDVMGGDGLRCWRGVRSLAMALLLTAPAAGIAQHYRFEDGAYLGSADLMPDWSNMLARYEAQRPEFEACIANIDACPRRYSGVHHLLNRARDLDPDKQIRVVNRYVNKRRYRRDRVAELDTSIREEPQRYRSRWTTPMEFLRRGGDCEDYATTKYFLLRELGFSADQLRVVVLWDRRANGYHAIVAVDREDSDVWLLESDNNIYKRRHLDYRYIYSLNEESVWDYEQPASEILQPAAPVAEAASAAAPAAPNQPTPLEATL